MTDWYKLHHKTALGLVLIIAQSSNAIKITAGKLFQLSISTFGDVSNAYNFHNNFSTKNQQLSFFYFVNYKL